MPSLYKGVALDAASKVSIPVAAVKTAPLQLNLDEEMFEKAIQVLAEALFQEKWKAVQAELAVERGQMLAEVDTERKSVLAAAEKEGHRVGSQRAKAEADKVMRQIQAGYKTLEADRVCFIEQTREAIQELVVSVAEEFLHEQLQRVPELLLNLVARAIQELVSKRKVCVFVHPSRVDTVTAHDYLLPGKIGRASCRERVYI